MVMGRFENDRFCVEHRLDEVISNRTDYKLHNHENAFELACVFSGNTKYTIEGTVYSVMSGDVLVVSPDEMHGLSDMGTVRYDRVMFYVSPLFFEHNNCRRYYDILRERPNAADNLVHMDSSPFNIRGRLRSINKYICDGNFDEPLLESAVTELLYMFINSRAAGSDCVYRNEHINKIIGYINSNLSDKLTLDRLSEELFISKQHLCKIFKAHTGLTINDYITKKRLMRVIELRSEKKNLLEACLAAGFCNYSSFYRAYVRQNGHPPREGLK